MESPLSEPVRGSFGDPALFAMSGLDVLRKYKHGEISPLPLQHLFGTRPTDVGPGAITFSMPVTRWLEDSAGLVWAGFYALFADAPLSAALYTALPPGKMVTTAELFMSFVRPTTRDTGNYIGRARTLHIGRREGLSQIHIEDRHGRLLAYGSTRCIINDMPVIPNLELAPMEAPIEDPPDPYLRQVPDDLYVDLEEHASRPMINNLRLWVDGKRPLGPSQLMLGQSLVDVQQGRFVMQLPTSPWFSNGGPFVHGGIIAWACDSAMTGAIGSTLEAGEMLATVDLQVRFLRPVQIDSGVLTAVADVVHEGHRLRVASVTLEDERRRPVAIASGSALVVRGGIHQLIGGKSHDEIVGETADHRDGGTTE
jgi:uncharacterized protein (TIGR00369 family)